MPIGSVQLLIKEFKACEALSVGSKKINGVQCIDSQRTSSLYDPVDGNQSLKGIVECVLYTGARYIPYYVHYYIVE